MKRTALSPVPWCWVQRKTYKLVAVNYADTISKARIPISAKPHGATYTFYDDTAGLFFTRPADEVKEQGLFVELPPYGAHVGVRVGRVGLKPLLALFKGFGGAGLEKLFKASVALLAYIFVPRPCVVALSAARRQCRRTIFPHNGRPVH